MRAFHLAIALAAAAGAQVHTVPFTTHANGVYLAVQVNGSRPLQFLFDSAAGTHVLNSARGREMNLGEPFALARADGAGDGSTTATVYQNVTLRAGSLELKAGRIAAIDMRAIEDRKGYALDGLIGGPLLREFVVEVDTGTSTMKLYDPASYRYTGNGHTLPARFDASGKPHVKAVLYTARDSPIEGEFLIDSAAAEVTAMLTTPFVDRHSLIEVCRRDGGVMLDEASGVGGTSRMWLGRPFALEIGDVKLARPVVSLMQAKGGTLARADIAGTLGGESLHRFRIIYDCSRGQIHLEPTERLRRPFEQEMAGLRWLSTGVDHRCFRVRAVMPGSPAEEAGMRVGDLLETVDGDPASRFDKASLIRHLTGEGRNVTLRVLRNGKSVEVNLKLRRLI